MDTTGDEAILSVGSEGGGLTLFRRPAAGGGSSYYVERNEVALAEMLGPEGPTGGAVRHSRVVASFDEALHVLDETPDWIAMYVSSVAPAYATRVLAAVEERLARLATPHGRARALARWRDRCQPTPR